MHTHSKLAFTAVLSAALGSACQPADGVGGLTANIVFGPAPSDGQRALRAAAPPTDVGRLEIRALETSGSTLAATILALEPGPDEQPLLPDGGFWVLEGVAAGTGRIIEGRAYYRADLAPGAGDVLAYSGRIEGIEVRVGDLTEAGTLELLKSPNRVPEADFEAPSAPNPVSAASLEQGGAIRITFAPPPETDVAGYVLAIATSTASASAPRLSRGADVSLGRVLAPGVRIQETGPLDGTKIITVEGLEDNVPVGVLVYAFDTDRDGQPLNFSAPAEAFAVPRDVSAPGLPTGLRGVLAGPGRVQIDFLAPAEDDTTGGAPEAYELRAAADRAPLESPSTFAMRPPVEPPPIANPGQPVTFQRTLAELGVDAGASFYIGLRALDAAANEGPIAIAEVVIGATLAPSLTDIAPPIGLAGREIVLTGAGFGTATGTVTLAQTETGTATTPLSISRWTDGQIIAALPFDARTGRLTITRPDAGFVSAPLTVIGAAPGPVDDYGYPFDAVGTGQDAPPISALYREAGSFSQRNAAVDRFYDGNAEGVPWTPAVEQGPSTWITGTYSQAHDRFLFIACNEDLSMTSALVTSSTIAPDPFRLPVAVTAGDADRVSVVITEGGLPGEVPAMVAFTIDGTIRTATVSDARFQPFDGFYATTSTSALYEAVTLARDTAGALLMAHRTVTPQGTFLALRDNPGGISPDAFTARPLAAPPRVGAHIELLSAPLTPGGAERFVVAYEHVALDGSTRIRLAFADDIGTSTGLAPFPETGRRLDDVGLVVREGEVYIALASTLRSATAELRYTEVPLAALSDPAAVDGAWPGVVVDIAPEDQYARLACKPYLQATCPIFWLGEDAHALFLRR